MARPFKAGRSWRVKPLTRADIIGAPVKKARAKMRRPEQDFQIKAVAPYLDAILDPATAYWLHVPNGGVRSPVEGGILKAMGVRAGFPDILVLAIVPADPCGYADEEIRACLIELKSPSGDGRLNASQADAHAALTRVGKMELLKPAVCESLEDVRTALIADGIPMRDHTLMGSGGFIVRFP